MNRKRSEIWNHFEPRDNNKAKCSYCSQIISAAGGSTGNLARHMRTKHVGISIYGNNSPELTTNSTNTTNTDTVTADTPVAESTCNATGKDNDNNGNQDKPGPSSARTQVPKQSKMNDFIKNTKPVSIHKSKEFDKQLVRMIVKEYQPFRLVEDIEFIRFVNLLCPGYSLPSRKTIYNSLIPQFYTTTKETVQNRLTEAFAVCVTTDGWTSINNESFLAVTAHWINGCIGFSQRHTAENLKEFLCQIFQEWKISNKVVAVISDNAANITAAVRLGAWRHLGCFAHTVNLVVQASLREIHETIEKVKKNVEFFRRSSHAQAKLNQIQDQMNLPKLKLKNDVVTRWNSTYDMLVRILKIKDAVISTLAIIGQEQVNALNPHDWLIVETATSFLEIFNEVTVEISAEKNVSASKIILFIQGKLMPPVNHYDNKVSEKSIENIVTGNSAVPSCSSSALWKDFDEDINKTRALTNPTAAGIVEMNKYLQEPLIDRHQDPLIWWKQRKDVYPMLYEIVKKRLCIVATSVPSERIFSKQILTARRNALKTDKLSQIIFLSHNLD
ncbi:hypothetical protein NQ317_003201 [Molorchus minor]|uniref:BED-type domain-containing protein n=1 Tax=Molorchus minor TaxID=1323400 RepID=A0ABQ9J2J6_9CUCU|nr:hypothetical protein NQ317_003201 [Molorchus minor]